MAAVLASSLFIGARMHPSPCPHSVVDNMQYVDLNVFDLIARYFTAESCCWIWLLMHVHLIAEQIGRSAYQRSLPSRSDVAGAMGGALVGSPRQERISRMTSGESIAASILIRALQRGHAIRWYSPFPHMRRFRSQTTMRHPSCNGGRSRTMPGPACNALWVW